MTTEQNLSLLLERLALVAPVRRPATEEAIRAVERRLGIRLSSEFRNTYLRLDGTADGTPPENGWFELWPLARWYTVEQYVQDWSEPERGRFKDLGAAIVFADYSIESWHYAVDFSADSSKPTAPIYLLHLQPYLVSESLEGFLAAALVDGPEIYPPGAPA